MDEIYAMIFKCCNCGTEFKAEVEKGKKANRRGGVCPYCGITDYDPVEFTNWKPSQKECDFYADEKK